MAACGSLSSAFQTNGAFHLCGGRNVELSNEKTVAQIGGNVKFPYPGRLEYGPEPSPVINVRRVVFSSKPIEFTGIFQVHVTRRKYQKSVISNTSYTFNPKNKGSLSDPQQNMVSVNIYV